MKLHSVYSFQVGDNSGDTGRQLGNRIPDVERRGNEAGHDFGCDPTADMVEENVVAIAVTVEMVEKIVGANLQVIG